MDLLIFSARSFKNSCRMFMVGSSLQWSLKAPFVDLFYIRIERWPSPLLSRWVEYRIQATGVPSSVVNNSCQSTVDPSVIVASIKANLASARQTGFHSNHCTLLGVPLDPHIFIAVLTMFGTRLTLLSDAAKILRS